METTEDHFLEEGCSFGEDGEAAEVPYSTVEGNSPVSSVVVGSSAQVLLGNLAEGEQVLSFDGIGAEGFHAAAEEDVAEPEDVAAVAEPVV